MLSRITSGIKEKYAKATQFTQASKRILHHAAKLEAFSHAKATDESIAAWRQAADGIRREAELFASYEDKSLYVHYLAFHQTAITFAVGLFDDLELQRECFVSIGELDQLMVEYFETIKGDLNLALNLMNFRIQIYQCILNVEVKKPNNPSVNIDANSVLKSINQFLTVVSENKKKMDFFDYAQFSWIGCSARIDANFHRLRFEQQVDREQVSEILSDINAVETHWLSKISKLSALARVKSILNQSLAHIEIGMIRDDWSLISKGMYALIKLTGMPVHGEETADTFEIDLEHAFWCMKAIEYRELNAEIPLGFDGRIEAIIRIVNRMFVAERYQKNYTFLETAVLLTNIYAKRENWEGVVAIADRILTNVRNSIGGDRDFEDFQFHITYLQKMGSEAAYAALKVHSIVDAPSQRYWGIEFSEATRSLSWKFGREKFIHREEKVDLFDKSNFVFNEESFERVNVFVDVATHGAAIQMLMKSGGKTEILLVDIPKLTRSALYDFVNGDHGWRAGHERIRRAALSRNLKDAESSWTDWNETVATGLTWLWDNLGGHIYGALKEIGVPQNSRVHIVCAAPLLSLPLASCGQINEQGKWMCLNDLWYVTVSDSILHNMYTPAEIRDAAKGKARSERLAVINPNRDLHLVSQEFFECQILEGNAARRNDVISKLRASSEAIFFCHANFDSEQPENSGLELSMGDALSLSDIRGLDLFRSPVVLLGACETAASDAIFQANEARNLATGLLWAGADVVIGAAWPIPIECAERMLKPQFDLRLETVEQHVINFTNAQRRLRQAREPYVRRLGSADAMPSSNDNAPANTKHTDFLEGLRYPAAWASFSIFTR